MRTEITIGFVFSTTGSYSTVSREMLHGAQLAVDEINADPERRVALRTEARNPGGDLNAYWGACQDLLKNRGIRHVVGCYTSSSRKEVIPLFEKFDALLWYPSHYEGFESADNVIYTGAAPNQHIVPLTAYMLRHFGKRAFCCGSNYIWAWENNRILREIVAANGGRIVAERYLPVGDTDVDKLIEEIGQTRPDFVFNTLIGETAYAFYRALHERGRRDPRFRPEAMPVTSCSLSEPELLSIGGEAAAGHICSSVYFSSVDSPANRRFAARFRERFGPDAVTSADAEASYDAVHLLAAAVERSGTTDPETVKAATYDCPLEAPQGPVWIDRTNNHAYLTPRLGRSRGNGTFAVLATASAPVKPDPYLVWFDARSLIPADPHPVHVTDGPEADPKVRFLQP